MSTFHKHASRISPSFYKTDADQEPSWYKDFIDNLKKQSVHSEQSIHEQICSIMGVSKSKFSNVEEVVKDMQERTGLKAYLDHKQAVAMIQEPEIFKEIPEMKVFIENFIDERPGTTMESVIHDLLAIDSIHDKLPTSDVDDDVKSYISKLIGLAQSKHSDSNHVDMNLGKVDQSAPETSNDPFAICEPSAR